MDRTKTGIPGFDQLIQGGLPIGSSVVLGGGAGTGKSIFAMQFLYEGAKTFKEPGIFVTMETNARNIVWNMESFGWDVKAMQEKELLKIYRLKFPHPLSHSKIEGAIENELKVIGDMAKDMGAKRIVVDPTTSMIVWVDGLAHVRSVLYNFANGLKDIGCTTLMTSETGQDKNQYSAFGVEAYIADAVVALYFTPPHRSIFIRKMRHTEHSKNVHPIEIGKNGICTNPKETILWEAVL